MKKLKKFFAVILCLSGVGFVAYKFFTSDAAKEKFFNSMYEDKILGLMDTGRLVWDLINWPIDYVRALLP